MSGHLTFEVRMKKASALPLLIALFVVSYGLLIMLVTFQDQTIDAQHRLIHQMVGDERRMTETIARAVHPTAEKAAAVPAGESFPKAEVLPQPSSSARSGVNPEEQAPSPQVKKQIGGRARRNARKVPETLPARPPAQITDPSDMRRVSVTI